jgi:arabinan endo-1,5-alpha-L-arabinosidase
MGGGIVRRALVVVAASCAVSVSLSAAPAYVHDPSIIKAGGTYYMFSTGHGIAMKRSPDLLNWEFLAPVFSTTPQWMRSETPGFSGDIWAPDVTAANGRYYLYFAVSSFGSNNSFIRLATNETLDPSSPDYRWVDQGKVIESVPGQTDWNAIDPNLVIEDAAHWYLAFGSFWDGIKMIALDPQTGLAARTPPEVLSLARRPGVKNDPIEAAFVYPSNGYWYLFVSFDYCCKGAGSDYKIAVGRSRSVTGPYVDASGTGMLEGGGTIVLQTTGDVHGPGAASVLRDGDSEYLVHHMYDGRHGGVPVLQIRPLSWSDTGWPVAGEPIGDAQSQKGG